MTTNTHVSRKIRQFHGTVSLASRNIRVFISTFP